MYDFGMYGGKFMPFHKGHWSCITKAASECEHVFLVLFLGGTDERKIYDESPEFLSVDGPLSVTSRIHKLFEVADRFDNVEPVIIDISACRNSDGTEDWDAETPIVLNTIGKFDAVYGSEDSYAEYFKRAYPHAEYRIVDSARKRFPISGTEIRGMTRGSVCGYAFTKEAKEWIV